MHSVDDEKASLTFPCFQSMWYANFKVLSKLGKQWGYKFFAVIHHVLKQLWKYENDMQSY